MFASCQILDEPIPEDCHPEQHADYAGIGLSWGLDHKTASAAQCVIGPHFSIDCCGP